MKIAMFKQTNKQSRFGKTDLRLVSSRRKPNANRRKRLISKTSERAQIYFGRDCREEPLPLNHRYKPKAKVSSVLILTVFKHSLQRSCAAL